MEPVLWLFGRIAEVSFAEAGQTVGYNATQTLKRRTRIATATAGLCRRLFPRAFLKRRQGGAARVRGVRTGCRCWAGFPWI